MGSLQDELNAKLANLAFVTPRREEGKGADKAPEPSVSPGIVAQQKLAGITPSPVPQLGSLADYAAEVTKLCEQQVGTVQALVTSLDRYSPTVKESQYRPLKAEMKQLQERLIQARRLAAAIMR